KRLAKSMFERLERCPGDSEHRRTERSTVDSGLGERRAQRGLDRSLCGIHPNAIRIRGAAATEPNLECLEVEHCSNRLRGPSVDSSNELCTQSTRAVEYRRWHGHTRLKVHFVRRSYRQHPFTIAPVTSNAAVIVILSGIP